MLLLDSTSRDILDGDELCWSLSSPKLRPLGARKWTITSCFQAGFTLGNTLHCKLALHVVGRRKKECRSVRRSLTPYCPYLVNWNKVISQFGNGCGQRGGCGWTTARKRAKLSVPSRTMEWLWFRTTKIDKGWLSQGQLRHSMAYGGRVGNDCCSCKRKQKRHLGEAEFLYKIHQDTPRLSTFLIVNIVITLPLWKCQRPWARRAFSSENNRSTSKKRCTRAQFSMKRDEQEANEGNKLGQ